MTEMRTATLPESGVSPRSAMLAYLALTTAAMVWGGSVVFQKSALSSFSPFEVSVLRGLGALLVLVPLWWWQEAGTVRFTARDMLIFAALSLGVLGNAILTFFRLRHVGAGAGGIHSCAGPGITPVLAALLHRVV